ncbi:MAG: hypothetical protein JWR54_1010, partial [Mucilaginibacter sp.]|nr:hypothetical protein [Mucilaginibacter sp.]
MPTLIKKNGINIALPTNSILLNSFDGFGIVYLFIPRVTKWFFNKPESSKTSHYVFIL